MICQHSSRIAVSVASASFDDCAFALIAPEAHETVDGVALKILPGASSNRRII